MLFYLYLLQINASAQDRVEATTNEQGLIEPGFTKDVGGMTWRFIRRQPPASTISRVTPTTVDYRPKNTPPLPLADRVRNIVMLDGDGEWEVADLDESVLDLELLRLAEDQVSTWDPVEDFEEATGTFTPESYSTWDCDNDSKDEMRVWNSESRSKKVPTFSARQEGAMMVNSTCSGMLLRSNWVLTAAHCLRDSNGNWDYKGAQNTDPNNNNPVAQVHDVYGNTVTAEALFGVVYTGDGDWNDDWALMKLTSSFSHDDMDLWTGADSDYKDIGSAIHKLGYPTYTLSSNGNSCVKNDNDTSGTLPGSAELFHQSNAKVSSVKAKKLKYKADGATRSSGSSYYFCPTGSVSACEAGDQGKVIGVHAGFWNDGITYRYVGPKATYFGGTAITIMDNN